MTGARVVVTGGRDYDDKDAVFAALDQLHAARPIELLAAGDADGADKLALAWAKLRGVRWLCFEANWSFGKAGGPMRNAEMLRRVLPDAVVAFPGGKGTADCTRQARRSGITVIEIK